MKNMPVVEIMRLENGSDLDLPSYESSSAAGVDLRAAIPTGSPISLAPGQRTLIPTGIAIALPEGFEGQIRPRSGLAHKFGISIVNSPGTVDADYRGEVKLNLVNLGSEPFEITRGERIGQLIIAPVVQAIFEEVRTLNETARGTGGFGSTGT